MFPFKVLLVTSDKDHCGVREYGRLLKSAANGQAYGHHRILELEEFPHPDPASLFTFLDCPRKYDLIHLNHHAAIHPRWKADHIDRLKDLGFGVVVTHHDTFENFLVMKERNLPLFSNADYVVIHEAVAGMGPHDKNVVVLHQPVPDLPSVLLNNRHRAAILGVFGLALPWKGFDRAIRAARLAGWTVRVVTPDISRGDAEELQAAAGGTAEIIVGWRQPGEVVQLLSECMATAFLYACANSGTSGAIRMGLAAHRPLLAYRCRQFRDLMDDSFREHAISWVDGASGGVEKELWRLATSVDYRSIRQQGIATVAAADSWTVAGAKYANVYVAAELDAKERRGRIGK